MSYIDFKAPDDLKKKVMDFLKKISEKNAKIKKGMNEVTKTIERGVAKFVIIAEDITPAEIVMHLPRIAQEKKIPYCFLSSKGDVGSAAGLKVGCSALAIVEFPKESEGLLKEIVNDITQLKK